MQRPGRLQSFGAPSRYGLQHSLSVSWFGSWKCHLDIACPLGEVRVEAARTMVEQSGSDGVILECRSSPRSKPPRLKSGSWEGV
jgi:hypothetical protein